MVTLTKDEEKVLAIIRDNPGTDAQSLPRKRRGEILKTLELNGLIHYGPGGWYAIEPIKIERCPVCNKPGHPGETDDLGRHPECQPKEAT